MKNKIIKMLFILIAFVSLFSCDIKDKNDDFTELSKIFHNLNLCLNVNEKTWNDSIKKHPNLIDEWRYYCDTANFKIYKIGALVPLTNVLLLEVRINHGSGEYDNYIIKNTDNGYKITCEFKGYLDSIIQNNDGYNQFIYEFYTSAEKKCKVLGSFDGEGIITDTILNFNVSECKDIFVKGQRWCE